MPCRSIVENIQQATCQLFETSMLTPAARLEETFQNRANARNLGDTEAAPQNMEEVRVPIASKPDIEESLNSRSFKLPRSPQKQDDSMSDCESEFEPWSHRLDGADLFAGDDRCVIENVHEGTLSRVRGLTEIARGSCALSQNNVNLCEAASDGGTSASCETDRVTEDQRRPCTKMDQLRAMVQETSRQVGTAIGQVKGVTQCSLPAKDSGATNHFTQLKLLEPMRPYFKMSDSGSTATLLGHDDPGSAWDVHERSNMLRPSSPTPPMCLPKSSKRSSARASVSPKKSKWKRAGGTWVKSQELSRRSPKRTSGALALVESQDMSLSTNSRVVACQQNCTIDEQAPRGQFKATLKNGRRSSRAPTSRSTRLSKLSPVSLPQLSIRERSGKSSSKAPR